MFSAMSASKREKKTFSPKGGEKWTTAYDETVTVVRKLGPHIYSVINESGKLANLYESNFRKRVYPNE